MTRTIRAFIFDLDACLSAANEVGDDLFFPAFEAIRKANQGAVSEETLGRAFADSWRFPFDSVARKHGFTEEMTTVGWREFQRIEVNKPMNGYGDLPVLGELPGKLFLVTSGFRRLQESKVRALGIQSLFEAIHIDAIDEPGPKGKERIFAQILQQHALAPGEVLVVGDNPDSEIAAGNKLGMPTVQVLRPGVEPGANAEFHIRSLTELKQLPGVSW